MNNEEILFLIKKYKLSNNLQSYMQNLLNEFKYQELIDLNKKYM